MDFEDPNVAQQVVAAYARVLERESDAQRLPAAASLLPYSRDAIKMAIRTSLQALAATGRLTADLRDFLETAYVGLADFVDDEIAKLMHEFNDAAADTRLGSAPVSERVATASWQRLQQSGALAGRIAQRIATDADELRAEFRAFESGSAAV
jgi:hypothetical protein